MAEKAKKIKLYGSFVLVGTAMVREDNFYSNKTSPKGYNYSTVNFGVKTADGNVLYLSNMGGFSTVSANVLKPFAKDKDSGQLEIQWADRNDEGIKALVSDMAKLSVNFEDTEDKSCKTFLSEYDFVEAIKVGLKKDMKVFVYGDIKIERYTDKQGNVKTKTKYTAKKIRLAKEEEANRADATMEFVFDKDCWDESRLKDGKADISAYFMTYDRTLKENVFVPLQMVVDIETMAENTARNLGKDISEITETMKETLYTFVKNKFMAEAGEYMQTQWKCKIVSGTVQEEITMEMLNDDQRMQIELGFATLDQIKAQMRGRFGGEKINEIRLLLPTNKYVDEKTEARLATILTDFVEEDFYAKTPVVEDKNEVFGASTSSQSDADMLKGLFGG